MKDNDTITCTYLAHCVFANSTGAMKSETNYTIAAN